MTTARDNLGLELTATRRRADRIGAKKRKISWQYWPTTSVDQIGETKLVDFHPNVQRHPDLEDEADICWGLAQSELHVARGPRAKVDVLYGDGNDLRKSYQIEAGK